MTNLTLPAIAALICLFRAARRCARATDFDRARRRVHKLANTTTTQLIDAYLSLCTRGDPRWFRQERARLQEQSPSLSYCIRRLIVCSLHDKLPVLLEDSALRGCVAAKGGISLFVAGVSLEFQAIEGTPHWTAARRRLLEMGQQLV